VGPDPDDPNNDPKLFTCDVDDEDDSVPSVHSDADSLVEVEALPPGPDSELGVYKWPKQHVADALNFPLTLAADVAELGGDVFINTSYSGMGSPEMVVPQLQREFRQQGVQLKVTCFRAAEWCEHGRRFLMEHKPASRPLHIQTDICLRLPSKAYHLLNGNRRQLKQTLEKHSIASQASVQLAQNELVLAQRAYTMALAGSPDGTQRPELYMRLLM